MLGKGFFEDASRIGAGAREIFGSLAGEVERLVKTKLEERLRKLRLVKRDEFEAVKILAENARVQVQELEERLSRLEKERIVDSIQPRKTTKSTKAKEFTSSSKII